MELLYWFKNDFFTWCNKPKCSQCHNDQDNMISIGTEISSEEEQRWLASRTEVYQCIECDLIARFPRYNSPYKLLETRTGRCGEYANTFGCIGRPFAAGLHRVCCAGFCACSAFFQRAAVFQPERLFQNHLFS